MFSILQECSFLITFLSLPGQWEMPETAPSPQDSPPAHTSSPCLWLTQTVVSVMCQVESVIAGASVIARDVDTVMHTTGIVFSFTLIHICGQRGSEAAGPPACPHCPPLGSALWWSEYMYVCVYIVFVYVCFHSYFHSLQTILHFAVFIST